MKIVVTTPLDDVLSRRCAPLDRLELAAGALGLATSCMSAESAREFVDANVLVYAFDSSAKARHTAASKLLEKLWESGNGCTSVQALQEFFVIITRKLAQPLSIDEAADRVRELTAWKVFAPTANDVVSAILLHKTSRLNFWDAMIIHAAAESGCDLLWTEDLTDQQVLRGVRICNPFKE